MQPGDTVYGSFGRYGEIDVREGKVTKVTPTGQVVADFGAVWASGQQHLYRFKNGCEIGGDQWHPASLITHEQFVRSSAAQAQKRAVAKIHKVAEEMRRVTHKEGLQAFVAELSSLVEALS